MIAYSLLRKQEKEVRFPIYIFHKYIKFYNSVTDKLENIEFISTMES